MVFGNILKDIMERADTKRVMERYGDCMGCTLETAFSLTWLPVW